MTLRKLSRSLFALWLGVFALAAAGLEQNQLAASVQWALVNEASQTPAAAADAADAAMPANCPMRQSGGHTHRGHSDCPICGAEMALAALILPSITTVYLSGVAAPTGPPAEPIVLHQRRTPSAYASRAPPPIA